MIDLIKKIKSTIESTDALNPDNTDLFIDLLSKATNEKFYLAKKSRWEDDSNIYRLESNSINLAIKMHEELFPIASHLYESTDKIEILNNSGRLVKVYDSELYKQNSTFYRFLFFEFKEGLTLDKAFTEPEENKIISYKNMWIDCIKDLLILGFHPFIKDMSDFMIIKEDVVEKVILLDHNALFDCTNSSKVSRQKVQKIIEYIVEKVISNDASASGMTRNYLRNIQVRKV